MIRPISKYRDEVLATRAREVEKFDGKLSKLVDDMWETMYAADGVGLAAPQIGVSLRVFVMDCSHQDDPKQKIVAINPEILETSETQSGGEGCLSVPGVFSELERPNRVRFRALDAKGKVFELEVEGLEARCVVHETDHLDGKLYLDRLTPLKRDLAKRRIRKLKRDGEW